MIAIADRLDPICKGTKHEDYFVQSKMQSLSMRIFLVLPFIVPLSKAGKKPIFADFVKILIILNLPHATSQEL